MDKCLCALLGHPDPTYVELRFGGRKPARFVCTSCGTEYGLDGLPLNGR